jgi:hypothetical protein
VQFNGVGVFPRILDRENNWSETGTLLSHTCSLNIKFIYQKIQITDMEDPGHPIVQRSSSDS